MARLATVNPETATGKAAELLAGVKGKLGMVPNMTKVMAGAPAVLESYVGISGALAGGVLSPKLREKIAVLSAQTNECGYCLSAHTLLGTKAGVTPDDITASRQGESSDPRDAAALRFAKAVLEKRGGVSDADLSAVRAAGFNDAEIAEITGHVVLNVFTNYFNRVADTEVDFPKVEL